MELDAVSLLLPDREADPCTLRSVCISSVTRCVFGEPQNAAREIRLLLPLHLLFSAPRCSLSRSLSLL